MRVQPLNNMAEKSSKFDFSALAVYDALGHFDRRYDVETHGDRTAEYAEEYAKQYKGYTIRKEK